MRKTAFQKYALGLFVIVSFYSCLKTKEEKAITLYNSYCSSCHLLPEIHDLPKDIWETEVLPDMAARMGLKDSAYNPFEKVSRTEKMAIMKSGIYPENPIISLEDWSLLKDYIISIAPDSLNNDAVIAPQKELNSFIPVPVMLDSIKGALITYMEYDSVNGKIVTANLNGKLIEYDANNNNVTHVERTENALTSYSKKGTIEYHTSVGYLNPSELASGSFIVKNKTTKLNPNSPLLHRPVHTLVLDFNNDGNKEVVVCEFGDLTGKLSLFNHSGDYNYNQTTLLNQPGSIRSIAKDMNNDKKTDLVVLTSQGREGINIFYQQDSLKFKMETPIKFSPVYGSSWFEILDYNNDGYQDIVTVQGDNADKSYVHKPYHGLRIHINDGNNNFEQKFFYPMNGATRFVSNDFDQDGDVDFAILSTFPDYSKSPTYSFVYLENKDPLQFNYEAYRIDSGESGRWMLMDSGDFDNDGDIDIVLSSFSYSFTPVPQHLNKAWRDSDVDLLILENTLNP